MRADSRVAWQFDGRLIWPLQGVILLLAIWLGAVPRASLASEGAGSAAFSIRLEIREAGGVAVQPTEAPPATKVGPRGSPVRHVIAVFGDTSPAVSTEVSSQDAADGEVNRRTPLVYELPAGGIVYGLPALGPEVDSVTWVLIYQ